AAAKSSCARSPPALGKGAPPGTLECALHGCEIIAAVEDHIGSAAQLERLGHGHLLGAHQIAPANLSPVHADLARRLVEQAFHDECRLRLTCTPYGGGRNLVRQDDSNVERICANIVR